MTGFCLGFFATGVKQRYLHYYQFIIFTPKKSKCVSPNHCLVVISYHPFTCSRHYLLFVSLFWTLAFVPESVLEFSEYKNSKVEKSVTAL